MPYTNIYQVVYLDADVLVRRCPAELFIPPGPPGPPGPVFAASSMPASRRLHGPARSPVTRMRAAAAAAAAARSVPGRPPPPCSYASRRVIRVTESSESSDPSDPSESEPSPHPSGLKGTFSIFLIEDGVTYAIAACRQACADIRRAPCSKA